MRVVIADPRPERTEPLAALLRGAGHGLDVADGLDELQFVLATARADLVVLQLDLAGDDGLDCLHALRRGDVGARILALGHAPDPARRCALLDAGADDVVVVPYRDDEVLARIRALLRRPAAAVPPVICAGNIALDTGARALSVGAEKVDLARREIGVLEVLLRNCGRLVARDSIENSIYGFDDEVSPNAIEATVSRLRRRLDAHGAQVRIEAVRGRGYVLTAGA